MATRDTVGTCVVLAAVLLMAAVAHALSPANKCEAAKLKIAGKYDFCRLKAAATAAKTGAMPDFSACDTKFGAKWMNAETAGAGMCSSNGDKDAIQAFITAHTDAVETALDGGTLPDQNCGNGTLDSGEDCDQDNLDGKTCATEGFAGGTLGCSGGCVFDTSGCWVVRFVDNHDGTISDNHTGLMWEKKTEYDGVSNPSNPHDVDNYYQWSGQCGYSHKYCQPTTVAATLCAANAEGGTTGCEECGVGEDTCFPIDTAWTVVAALNDAAFAGHSDWRLPKRSELESIVDYSRSTAPVVNVAFQGSGCGPTCTDITSADCSCTTTYDNWSASSVAVDTSMIWVQNFYSSYQYAYFREALGSFVRAVRGGS